MAKTSTIVTLPQMVDLALNAPEVGAVNFNILHALLHVIIQQQELMECKVEFRGNDSTRVQNLMGCSKPGPTLNLTEYAVDPSGKARKKKKKDKKADATSKGKDDISISSTSSFETVVVVEPTQDGLETPHISVAVDRNFFENMERDVKLMKQQISELLELPSNQGLIEALQSEKVTPVLDMFQILNLKKRVDSVEEGVNKLASILEDIAKGGNIANALDQLRGTTDTTDGEGGGGVGGTEGLSKCCQDMKEMIEDLKSRVTTIETEGVTLGKSKGEGGAGAGADGTDASPENIVASMKDVEDKFKEVMDAIASLDCMFNNQIEIFHNQLCALEKEVGGILEKINAGGFGGGAGEIHGGDFDEANFIEIHEKLAKLEKDIEDLQERNLEMVRDREDREGYINTLVEQIEFLRNIKANREDMEDALAEKADVCAVNKKVNYDQFEQAYEEINKNIDDTLAKLTQQEALWQQTLDEIQNEIANKLDKADLRPLKDYVNAKLKQLQDRLKALAALKRDTEAAGTKSKMLRNVNCISCDKDVVMRKEMDPSLFPPKPSLPPTKSMAPYLAYELDALRKQQRCSPQGRNLNHFENVMETARKPERGDHICNRYCGGSHTVTTPQQRVTRMGHFLQQWGPETQAEEGQIRGTDGQMYKASEIKATHKEEMVTEEYSFKSRPSMVVHGDILTARSNIKSARQTEPDIKEAEISVVEPEEKVKRASAEVTTERKSSKTPRSSKDTPPSVASPKGSPRGSKDIKRTSKGSKDVVAEGGETKRSSRASKSSGEGSPTTQEEEGTAGQTPAEEESPEEEGSPGPEEAAT